MCIKVLEPVPGRLRLRRLLLRKLLLRLEPEDKLCGKPRRLGRFVRLSKCSSSSASFTNQTVDLLVFEFRATDDGIADDMIAGSESVLETSTSTGWSGNSSADHIDDTRER